MYYYLYIVLLFSAANEIIFHVPTYAQRRSKFKNCIWIISLRIGESFKWRGTGRGYIRIRYTYFLGNSPGSPFRVIYTRKRTRYIYNVI